jgi:hypothetical protein
MKTIDPARVERILAEANLRVGSGNGVNGKIDVCVMQAVDYITGGDGISDHPECADLVISEFCIRLNDAPRFAKWRDELKPYIVRIAGTKADEATSRKRAYMCADWAIRTIAPHAFGFWADVVPARRVEALSWATRLRDLPAVTDKQSANTARDVCNEANKAESAAIAAIAANAAYAAYAAANAAYAAAADNAYAAADAAADNAYAAAADNAYAAADAAAAAADNAYAAADAAVANAYAADAFTRFLWESSLAQLDAIIALTETNVPA